LTVQPELAYNHPTLAVPSQAPTDGVVRALAAQLSPVLGDTAGNRARSVDALAAAAEHGARLVVLPELCTSGYAFADAAEARAAAEPVDGASVRAWHQAARVHGLVVVAGLCELDADGALRNSAVVVDPTGVLAVYRKTHLWDREPEIFVPGDLAPPVLDTAVGRLGLAVCFDAAFPEHIRRAALAGAEIVAVPMNSPAPPRPTEPIPIEIAIAMAAANASRVYVVQADRTGEERGVRWAQASVIVDPDGSVIAGPSAGEALLVADLDLARARDKSWGDRNDVFVDRRPELYSLPSPTPQEPTTR
jgi:5-aminopentanamidase